MTREWKPGDNIPVKFSGMPVTFAWNDWALTLLLRALESEYRPGYVSMCDHIREAMRNYTPPKPDEPTGLGAVVEDHKGYVWFRDPVGSWRRCDSPENYVCHDWSSVPAVRILSEGVQ